MSGDSGRTEISRCGRRELNWRSTCYLLRGGFRRASDLACRARFGARRFDPGEHRRGAWEERAGRLPQSPLTRPRIAPRARNPASDRTARQAYVKAEAYPATLAARTGRDRTDAVGLSRSVARLSKGRPEVIDLTRTSDRDPGPKPETDGR